MHQKLYYNLDHNSINELHNLPVFFSQSSMQNHLQQLQKLVNSLLCSVVVVIVDRGDPTSYEFLCKRNNIYWTRTFGGSRSEVLRCFRFALQAMGGGIVSSEALTRTTSFKPDAVTENHLHLGRSIYTIISDFADVAQIHLRQYELDATGSH
ncbi:hypothetical protein NPIL_229951 [Nephila pilipes]|uniref:Uncharacterized protein n=1 Tax=Nephila pilipes TaxID=299642 RepID=A0A8X6J030_NEPPI|nr:hypothetical protein NPIL_229951 [Nephila pilipes]